MRYVIGMCLWMCLCLTSAHAQKEWEDHRTDYFRIYARAGVEDFVDTVKTEAEDSLTYVLNNLGVKRYQIWAKAEPVLIYIYANEEDYVKNGGQAGWSHGAALVATRTIHTFPAAAGFFDSILPHELGHIVLHEYLGKGVSLPLWFDEGVAVYQEKAKQLGGHEIVREAIKNEKFIPLNELMNMRLYFESDIDTVRLFYAQSASLVNFMIKQLGDYRFYKLLLLLKEGKNFEDSLFEAYPRIRTLDDLNKQWKQYLTAG